MNAWMRVTPEVCESCGSNFIRIAHPEEYPKGEKMHIREHWRCNDCGCVFPVPISILMASVVLLLGASLAVGGVQLAIYGVSTGKLIAQGPTFLACATVATLLVGVISFIYGVGHCRLALSPRVRVSRIERAAIAFPAWSTALSGRLVCKDEILREDAELRGTVIGNIQWSREYRSTNWKIAATCGVFGFVGVPGLFRLYELLTTHTPWWIAKPTIALVYVLVILAMPLLWSRLMTPAIRRELLTLGIPVCQKCGYDLRGAESRVCPECGTDVSPAVQNLINLRAKRTEGEA
jgi:predicted Zn-ribbon and HTH transcriptional regulator